MANWIAIEIMSTLRMFISTNGLAFGVSGCGVCCLWLEEEGPGEAGAVLELEDMLVDVRSLIEVTFGSITFLLSWKFLAILRISLLLFSVLAGYTWTGTGLLAERGTMKGDKKREANKRRAIGLAVNAAMAHSLTIPLMQSCCRVLKAPKRGLFSIFKVAQMHRRT